MPELQKNQINTIAFYLPQFHAIPENDEAYGKGFTEWTNTKKARPLYEGHYQPRIPYNENYYCLLDADVMKKQAAMAKQYGIYGFCYYHYWFKDGKKLLEKPVEMMLKDPGIDIPFCLSWANENWSKRWDGGNNEIIALQEYGSEKEWDEHLQYLVPFFNDERYIKINGKPVFLIYKPELMDDYKKWVAFMRKEIKKYGFPGIVIMVQYPHYYLNGYPRNIFDYYIQFEPGYTRELEALKNKNAMKFMIKKIFNQIGLQNLVHKIEKKSSMRYQSRHEAQLDIREYEKDWEDILSRSVTDNKMIPGCFVDWDNTPRNVKGVTYRGAHPEKFGKYFSRLIKKSKKEYKKSIIFVNAWNEWAEGAYLEPDQKYGYAYLEELKRALEEAQEENFCAE